MTRYMIEFRNRSRDPWQDAEPGSPLLGSREEAEEAIEALREADEIDAKQWGHDISEREYRVVEA